tara:strand:- start:31811 stop:32467 length:657 start_codon:yes stop_codon:yes gene_type:complete
MRSDFYTARGTHVYFKDDLNNEDIDAERVVAKLESVIPDHLLSELEMIIIGWFDEFEERNINAFYKDGILHVSNVQDNEEDMFDDFVHEVAHSIEIPYSYEIYGDQEIRDEFLRKRKLLHDKLWALDYKAPLKWFMETEYDEEFDKFLFEKVGKDKLRMICMGLFINAYAAVSLREYFATGFTDFYLYSNHNFFKKVSPQLYKKITLLNEIKNLDSDL